jgi:hypothetical protein
MTYLLETSPQPILVVRVFLHLCLNEISRVHGPIRAYRPIKYSLSAVLFTENSLDMLVEHSEKALRAMDSLEIPETPSVPAFPHDLSLRSDKRSDRSLLLFKSLYEFINDRLETLKMFPMLDIVDRSTSQPIRWCL